MSTRPGYRDSRLACEGEKRVLQYALVLFDRLDATVYHLQTGSVRLALVLPS
ncbi:hypothetical protein [Natrarchaeobius halalkaliphilus]|uniref:hypothetical protein n=1 Tax=Natrarchaeobius halalkaliphilus TaxID=1679091 RepID=UPI0014051A18|nr:hypothetical protein [Natrarchaeobius halalkaliphilus]